MRTNQAIKSRIEISVCSDSNGELTMIAFLLSVEHLNSSCISVEDTTILNILRSKDEKIVTIQGS